MSIGEYCFIVFIFEEMRDTRVHLLLRNEPARLNKMANAKGSNPRIEVIEKKGKDSINWEGMSFKRARTSYCY